MNTLLTVRRVPGYVLSRSLPFSSLPLPGGAGLNELGPDPGDKPKKYAILFAGSDSFRIAITDPEETISNAEETDWAQISRPQAKPLLLKSGGKLKTLQVKGMLYLNGAPVDFEMKRMEYMSTREPAITFAYGGYEDGLYRITSLSFTTPIREAGTNNVIAANFDMTLTEASDIPKPKPVPNAPAPPIPPPEPAKTDPPKTTYTVKKGDTLYAIAQKFYSAGNAFKRIADANGVKDPRRIQPGQVLVIP